MFFVIMSKDIFKKKVLDAKYGFENHGNTTSVLIFNEFEVFF